MNLYTHNSDGSDPNWSDAQRTENDEPWCFIENIFAGAAVLFVAFVTLALMAAALWAAVWWLT